MLRTEGGRPARDEPRDGGGAGNDMAEGDVNGPWCEDPRTAGLLAGGGGGIFALSDLGLFSFFAGVSISSSALGDSLPASL
jgi:hypothetical protein